MMSAPRRALRRPGSSLVRHSIEQGSRRRLARDPIDLVGRKAPARARSGVSTMWPLATTTFGPCTVTHPALLVSRRGSIPGRARSLKRQRLRSTAKFHELCVEGVEPPYSCRFHTPHTCTVERMVSDTVGPWRVLLSHIN